MKCVVETSRGAKAGQPDADWTWLDDVSTIVEARNEVHQYILARLEFEDRGEEYERGWGLLANRAPCLKVGEPLVFDERAWRIMPANAKGKGGAE